MRLVVNLMKFGFLIMILKIGIIKVSYLTLRIHGLSRRMKLMMIGERLVKLLLRPRGQTWYQ